MNSATSFTDIQMHRYIFLNRCCTGNESPVDCWDDIWQMGVQAAHWLFDQIGKPPPAFEKPELNFAPTESQPFLGFDWKDSADGKLWVSFLGRIFSQTAYLHLILWRPGQSAVGELKALQKQMEEFRPGDPSDEACADFRLGETYAVAAEVEPHQHIPGIFHTTLPDLLDMRISQSKRIETGRFPWGHVAIPREQKSPALLLRKVDSPGADDAAWFINVILPRIGISYFNMKRQNQDYGKYRPLVDKELQTLSNMLENRVKGGNLKELERQFVLFSGQLDKLAEAIRPLQQFLIRMDTDLRNIRRQVNDLALHGQSKLLWYVFGESAALLVDQIKVDFKNSGAYNDEAQLALQTLQTFVDVERAKTDRKMVLMLGVVGLVLALIDGFSDVIPERTRWIIFAIGFFIGLCIWFWGRGPFSFLKQHRAKQRHKKHHTSPPASSDEQR